MKPKISLIAAIGKNRELGRGNDLIFKIPEDMKHFREVTNGHPIIMGRKTFESIGRVLPNRLNIVITRSPKESEDQNLVYVSSLNEAIEKARRQAQGKQNNEIFVIGGGQVFNEAIKIADKLYLTIVDSEDKDADVFFPDYSEFKKIINERKSEDENYSFTFLELSKFPILS